MLTKPLLLTAVALVVAAVDQVSKMVVTSRLVEGQVYVLAGRSSLRRVTNRRAGMLPLSNRRAAGVWLVAITSLALMLAVLGAPSTLGAVGLGLVLGGATSNLFDRLMRGAVVDFVAVGRWPIFNLADCAIVGGAVVAASGLL